MTVHVVPSAARLSAFRIARLLERLAPKAPGLTGLLVQDFFLVQGDADPAALRRLLGDGPAALPDGAGRLFVVPRLGTVSPWSSKATDIARVCGLEAVHRVELARVVVPQGVETLPPEAYADLHDPMMESVLTDAAQLAHVFDTQAVRPLRRVPVLAGGREALVVANRDWGLALSGEEIDYLVQHALASKQDPSDAELMMFAQVNSEHCRHKIFNAEFTVDGAAQPLSLFQMIKESTKASPQGVLSAYHDNAAVIEGHDAMRWFAESDHVWRTHDEAVDILMKVETHNHPTGISPHPGAATGAGGEIRDEAATGRGGKPKAGLCGFTVANLRIPGFAQPWESDLPRPPRMASALNIMLEAPIGAAAYNNEFGRPNLAGYFRSFEAIAADGRNRGFHKPIMIAGGYGNIRRQHVDKMKVVDGAQLIVLGGPAMLIGLGGGAASSMATGASSEALDYASVQRANPELERRCQEVVDACWALGDKNPILSVHDVGAGGISNALPELVHADDRGGHFRLRSVLSADPALSPMEIWCNESQERYVLAVRPEGVAVLQGFCARERCPMAVVGTATAERQLIVEDADGSCPVDMPMPVLLGKPPRMRRDTQRAAAAAVPFAMPENFEDAARRVLQHPSVASKQFLITIGDRTVGGLTVRDQMVGPWQVPVADCAVTASGFESTTGEAMSMGERPVLALLDAPASGRMAVGEAITNILSARIGSLSDVRLSANWMAACGQGDEDARLFDTVRAVGAELCPALGIAIPVGKDSLSMKSVWSDAEGAHTQIAPLSLIVTAFAPVLDVRASLTPQLRLDAGETALVLIDLGAGKNRLGGSILTQVYSQLGETPPDLDDPAKLKAAFELVQRWNGEGRVLACHDRSDGGLLATLCEMAFAGHCGLRAAGLDAAGWFAEELGLVLQVRAGDTQRLLDDAQALGLNALRVGAPSDDDRIVIEGLPGKKKAPLLDEARSTLFKAWFETSYRMARLRDNPDCVDEEFESTGRFSDTGLSVSLSFDPQPLAVPAVTRRPRVAVLREQGVNGQYEMAYAFHAAGFEAVDVHMSDILEGRVSLSTFQGLVACGGFSYGDVLGAGQGWAKTILFNPRGRDEFQTFLADTSKFALGVCNGCQMFAALQELVPGASRWPMFRRNRSEQFEARWTMVEVLDSKSILFAGMAGSRMPIAVAHGEGRAEFRTDANLAALKDNGQVAMRFIDNQGEVAARYPANPNGSPSGLTSICNEDGRVTILMPHPERTIHGVTGSWWPDAASGGAAQRTPWFRMFENARSWMA
ncbi:phosphoribosylformylglycinamidine synthase [Panacagrimonas perspica]|uniref:Phosphoribosylformylglycinamidine synthase n=1 Tax=Panacagrimonas perspica TaxID=381431 RepID=A0A4V3URS4_9GAMM|nr:phosphoribosylformylglycinamidine synthase [Panacagrimonas perspica]TDU26671.1 phosphoribosylformylglycinamidine synthase [Panacagrimonas perspica]THD04021.1 phosphoribosylformylglycinamidine synthase [Panacagrimonas perspica]